MEMIPVSEAMLSAASMGEGPAVVFLHGLVFGNMATWYFPLAMPLASSRRVILYDQRGHGSSSVARSGFDLDTQARDLLEIIDHFGERQVDLVGHSVGAIIALQFALTHRVRVRRLILVDAPVPATRYVAPSLAGATSEAALADCVDRLRPHATPASGRQRQRLAQRLQQLLLESSLIADINAMNEPCPSALAQLDIPTLLIYGRQSPCREAGLWLMGELPNARYRELQGGHYLPEEQPDALRECIAEFLAEEAS